MNSKKFTPPKNFKIIFSLVALGLITAAGLETKKLSESPKDEKDCSPVLDEDHKDLENINFIENESPLDLLNFVQKGGIINDISCLNKTSIFGIVEIESENDIKNSLNFAEKNNLKVSAAGVRHSMGGQAFYKNNLVLDIKKFNKMSLNAETKTLTVQSGATWHDIQNFLHPKFAVKAMQSTDIFTVGGSISVNAHGMDHQAGSVGSSIKSMRIMNARGDILKLSRNDNTELFRLVIGGYGLFGVILDAEIEVVNNDIYKTERRIVNYKEFPDIFEKELLPNPNLGLFYGHLSTAKSSLLKEMILYEYKKTENKEEIIPALEDISNVGFRRFIFNLSKKGDIPMRLKWYLEKNIEPKIETCTIKPRTFAMSEGEECYVSRNEPMHDSVPYIQNNLKNDTDILHEYFIPRENLVTFIDGLREIVEKDKINLLNASVRVVHPEDNFLSYAPVEMFAVVLYINQPTNEKGNEKMKEVTRELIDLTSNVNGKFFLPYQLHYTDSQLKKSYPNIDLFFSKKRTYDPGELFTNSFYEKYGKVDKI